MRDGPTTAVNGAFGEVIDRGYISIQVLDMCKITDRSNDDLERGVISLPRLRNVIKKRRNLVTREIFVSYDETAICL